MPYYADRSFLVSCYLPDADTASSKAWLMRSNVPLPRTALQALEVSNALRLGVFRGSLTPEQVDAVMGDLETDRTGRRGRPAGRSAVLNDARPRRMV